jgi:hypothetical protein
MRGMTTYFLISSPLGEIYYGTHFRLQSMPDLGKSTSELYVGSTFPNSGEQMVYYYGPTYSNKMTDIPVSVGPVNWSYKGDCILPNSRTAMMPGQFGFKIWQDVDKSKKYDHPIVIEPGVFSSSTHEDEYFSTDVYSIQFCEQRSMIDATYETFEVKCDVKLDR